MGLNPESLKNFAKYNIPGLITRVSSASSLPAALIAAVVDMESCGEPGKFNFYPNGVGNPPKKVGTWVPGTALPDGTAGQPNAWAAGLMQIIRKYPRGLSLAERFDPTNSLRVTVLGVPQNPGLADFYARAAAKGLTGRDLWAASYYGHNQGGGPLNKALASLTADGDMKAAVKRAAISDDQKAAFSTAWLVASRVPLWAVALAPQNGGAAIGAEIGVVADDPSSITVDDVNAAVQMVSDAKQDAVTVLLAAAQQAEMRRDLGAAMELRSQLSDITGVAEDADTAGATTTTPDASTQEPA